MDNVTYLDQSAKQSRPNYDANSKTRHDALSFLAHDIRNMAASAVLDATDLMKSPDPVKREYGTRIREQIDCMIDICASVTAPAQMREELMGQYAQDGRINLYDVFTKVLSTLSARDQAVDVTLACDPNSRTDLCPVRLFRITYNLLSNAIKALRHSSSPMININVLAFSTVVTIDIRDNGPGLPERDVTYFEQTHHSFRTTPGLGLAVARDLARELNGDLSLISSGPDGAHFRLVFIVREQKDWTPTIPKMHGFQLRETGPVTP